MIKEYNEYIEILVDILGKPEYFKLDSEGVYRYYDSNTIVFEYTIHFGGILYIHRFIINRYTEKNNCSVKDFEKLLLEAIYNKYKININYIDVILGT